MKVTYLILVILIHSAHAFKFSPMSLRLKSKGIHSRGQVSIENDSKETIAVEISAAKRVMDINGVEKRIIDKEDIQIFPPQIILKPNQKKTVRVIWKGKNEVKAELAYRLIASQVPLDFNKKKNQASGIKILLKYVAGLYIIPEETTEKMTVKSAQIKKGKIKIHLVNDGNTHKILKNANITLNSEKLTAEELKGILGENILANSERIFSVEVPKRFKRTKNLKINFKVAK